MKSYKSLLLILSLYVYSFAYANSSTVSNASLIKNNYTLELMSVPFINALNVQYSITEQISVGAGTSVMFLRFPEEIKHLPLIGNATYYFSRQNESSWYTRLLLLQGYPLLDLGYRWSFDSWTLGLGSTFLYGPNPLHGPDFLGFLGASVGVKL